MGVDVSRGGSDDTVLILRYSTPSGDWIARPVRYPGQVIRSGGQVTQAILQHWKEGVKVCIDAIGPGASVVDSARGYIPEECIIPINGGSTSYERSRIGGRPTPFKNTRCELYWRIREALEPEHGTGMMLPPDDRMKDELNTIRWEAGSSIGIEKKEKVQQRIGRSPDTSDALTYALYEQPYLGFL